MFSAVYELNLFNFKIYFDLMEQNSNLKQYFKINTVFMIYVNLIKMGSMTEQAVARIFKFVENVFIIEREHMALNNKRFSKQFLYLDLQYAKCTKWIKEGNTNVQFNLPATFSLSSSFLLVSTNFSFLGYS